MNLKPLVTIWTRPTATMTYMKNETNWKYSILILALAAIATGGYQIGSNGFFPDWSLPMLIIVLVASTFVGCLLSWVIGSALYTWIGKGIFGGTGTFSTMLRVVPATSLPMIWMAPLNYAVIATYGKLAFEVPPEGSLQITYLPLTVYMLTAFITFALGIFAIVISSKGIGLVHGFSAWRGFGVNLLVLVVGFFLSLLVVLFMVLTFSIL